MPERIDPIERALVNRLDAVGVLDQRIIANAHFERFRS
jgi:hypothetical protein